MKQHFFKFSVIFSAALLIFSSCSDFSDSAALSEFTVSGKISSSAASGAYASRAALPSFSADGLSYYIYAMQNYDGNSYCLGSVSRENDGSLSYEITLRASGNWNLYVRAFIKEGTSEKTSEKDVLYGSGEYSTETGIAPTISLSPVFYTDGEINLSISESLQSYTLDHAQYKIDFGELKNLSFNNGTANISLSESGGSHKLRLYFYDSNGYLLYSCVENVTVLAGFSTTTWSGTAKHLSENSNGSKDFVLTDDCVDAFQSSSYWVDTKTGDDSYSGSASNKFKTIQAAVNKLLAFNDGKTRYKIYYYDEVKDESTVSYSSENHNAWINIESEKPFYLEIVSLNGGGERQNYITANGTGRVLYIGSNVDVMLSNGATISCGGNVEKGGGVYVASGGKLTLMSSGYVGGNSASLAGSEDVYVENGGVVWFKQWNYIENLYLEKGAQLWACQWADNSDGYTNLTLSEYDTGSVWMQFLNYALDDDGSGNQTWNENITVLTDENSIQNILNRVILKNPSGKTYRLTTAGTIEES